MRNNLILVWIAIYLFYYGGLYHSGFEALEKVNGFVFIYVPKATNGMKTSKCFSNVIILFCYSSFTYFVAWDSGYDMFPWQSPGRKVFDIFANLLPLSQSKIWQNATIKKTLLH